MLGGIRTWAKGLKRVLSNGEAHACNLGCLTNDHVVGINAFFFGEVLLAGLLRQSRASTLSLRKECNGAVQRSLIANLEIPGQNK